MISVSVFINNRRIVSRYAVMQDQRAEDGARVYRMDDGTELADYREGGAIRLAQRMLAIAELQRPDAEAFHE